MFDCERAIESDELGLGLEPGTELEPEQPALVHVLASVLVPAPALAVPALAVPERVAVLVLEPALGSVLALAPGFEPELGQNGPSVPSAPSAPPARHVPVPVLVLGHLLELELGLEPAPVLELVRYDNARLACRSE